MENFEWKTFIISYEYILIKQIRTQPKKSLDCKDSNSINYDINQCGVNNAVIDELETDSDTEW